MIGKCKKCKENVSELMNCATSQNEIIECPKCRHKMTLKIDIFWNGKNEYKVYWLENYKYYENRSNRM